MNVGKTIFVGSLAVLGSGALGFVWRDLKQGKMPDAGATSRLAGVRTVAKQSSEEVFRQTFSQIRHGYYRAVKPDSLKYAGIQGLMGSLGDPHTIFLPPRAAAAFSEETRGNFYGVGARLQGDTLGAAVRTVFEDGPAYAAGLRAGDVIIQVNGKKVSGQPIDDIVQQIKGKEGTLVTLVIARPKAEKPISMQIKRARIVAPSVESKYLEGSKMGYVSISNFAEPTTEQFDKELSRLDEKKITGLVIDLRSNPGGLLDTAAELMSRFVENKTVVTMRGRDGREEIVRSYSGAVRNWPYPVAVLIDENSASASEIFAGGLQDYKKATLVGTHSYGKASVQNIYPIIDRSSAKITIAKYYLPGGEFIGRKVDDDGIFVSGGLKPDVEVELNLDGEIEFGNPAKDNQLQRAIDVLKTKN